MDKKSQGLTLITLSPILTRPLRSLDMAVSVGSCCFSLVNASVKTQYSVSSPRCFVPKSSTPRASIQKRKASRSDLSPKLNPKVWKFVIIQFRLYESVCFRIPCVSSNSQHPGKGDGDGDDGSPQRVAFKASGRKDSQSDLREQQVGIHHRKFYQLVPSIYVCNAIFK